MPCACTASNAKLPTRVGPLTESRMTQPTEIGTIGILMVTTNAVSRVETPRSVQPTDWLRNCE